MQKAEREDYGASLDYLLAVAEACGLRVCLEVGMANGPKRVDVRLRRA